MDERAGCAHQLRATALRTLLAAVLDPTPRPLALAGQEQRFANSVLAGSNVHELMNTFELTADEVIAALWRIAA